MGNNIKKMRYNKDLFSRALIRTSSGRPKFVLISKLITKDIQYIRKRTGMSKAELARSMGIGRRTLYNWENGKSTPRVEVFLTIRGYADILRKGGK